MLVAGVDVGNQTTEAALAIVESGQAPRFLASSLVATTGIKGTRTNLSGIAEAIGLACIRAGQNSSQIDLIAINRAAPVVAGIAMQAITETILTDSALIGHNPETPGGGGLGIGTTASITDLNASERGPIVVVVPAAISFDRAAATISSLRAAGVMIVAAIVQGDDGVLIANRIGTPRIPIVDEVRAIEAVPIGQRAAVEVAAIGAAIQTLCNPYRLASIFDLDPETTARLAPAARALTGTRSAVVIRTPHDAIRGRTIAPGTLSLKGKRSTTVIDLEEGAAAVMAAIRGLGELHDVDGEPGTTAGAMFAGLKAELGRATMRQASCIQVKEVLAVDLRAPQPVAGGLSHEVALEHAVALAALVETDDGVFVDLAAELEKALGVPVRVGGSEAEAGLGGGGTTPGAGKPFVVLDLGSGSTNAARRDADGRISRLHFAGGGALVNLLIGTELGIDDPNWQEDLKRHRVAFVESLFSLRHEDRSLQFFPDPLPADFLGKTVLLADDRIVDVPTKLAMEKVISVRRQAKSRVFGANAKRALETLAPGGNLRSIGFVALIGGSALDFEIPGLLADQFGEYGIVVGAANVRGTEGPRNAVATGLVLAAAGDALSP